MSTNDEIRLHPSWRERFARAREAATDKAQEMIDLPECMVSGALVGPLMRHCSTVQSTLDLLLAELDGRFREPMVLVADADAEPEATKVRDEVQHEEELREHLDEIVLHTEAQVRCLAPGREPSVHNDVILTHAKACRRLLRPREAADEPHTSE